MCSQNRAISNVYIATFSSLYKLEMATNFLVNSFKNE